jgi:hypothetical protein
MKLQTWIGLALCAGCAHAGTGQGQLEKPTGQGEQAEGPVVFNWSSDSDPSEGKLTATLSDGRVFDGTYLQLTSTTLEPTYGPYYSAWAGPRWGVGGPWYTGPQDQFVTEYSGKVIAHLTSPDDTRMRCKFVLRKPESGMLGGAQGDCQLSTKESVFGAVIKPQ